MAWRAPPDPAPSIRLPITLPVRPPRDLPRLLMRRAGVVVLAVLLLALSLGLARIGSDIEADVDAAVALAQLVARLGPLAQADDTQALVVLRAVEAQHPPRHLLLSVQAQDGRQLLTPAITPPDAWPLRALLTLHQRFLPAPDARQVSWTLARPGGERWTLLLTASPESERREAVINLAGTLALLLACNRRPATGGALKLAARAGTAEPAAGRHRRQ